MSHTIASTVLLNQVDAVIAGGESARDAGKTADARMAFEVALAGLMVIVGGTRPDGSRCWTTIWRVHCLLGVTLARADLAPLALPHFEKARELRQQTHGFATLGHVLCCIELASCYYKLGRCCEAAAMVRKTLSAIDGLGGYYPRLLSQVHALHYHVEKRLGHTLAAKLALARVMELGLGCGASADGSESIDDLLTAPVVVD
ncbi:MAG: tetratricopeptide repeat protein [Cyanobacteria bacterium SZAS LIN-3]|nr:tetratricopeptide repeat protein [Cyanobacteria bacterium SZAS LIN-3]